PGLYSPVGAISCAKEQGTAPMVKAMDTRSIHAHDSMRTWRIFPQPIPIADAIVNLDYIPI
ncbi:MAG: hypothetical protein WCD54_06970, partial [Pseudolabrys sp.]